MPWSSHGCIYFTRNVCERYINSLKPSLEHDRKLALRLLRLDGDQTLICSNCKPVKTIHTVMRQFLWLSPSPEQARPHVEASERKLRDVGFFLTSSKSREEIEKFQRE